jgi:hypothetical protein
MTMDQTTDDDQLAEVEKLRGKVRELLAENRRLKDTNATLTARTSQQEAALRRYELDAPVERAIAEVAMPGCEELWRMAFERSFEFRIGPTGAVSIVTKDGEPAVLVAQPGVPGRETERPARLEPADLRVLAGAPEFLPITMGSKGSGGGASGSHKGSGATSARTPKMEEPPKRPTLGLR